MWSGAAAGLQTCRTAAIGRQVPPTIGGLMTTERRMRLSLASAMDNAEFLLIDGVVFETEYLRDPGRTDHSPTTSCSRPSTATPRSLFTREEMDDAEHLGDGVYRLKSGEQLGSSRAPRFTEKGARASARPLERPAPTELGGPRALATRGPVSATDKGPRVRGRQRGHGIAAIGSHGMARHGVDCVPWPRARHGVRLVPDGIVRRVAP